MSLCCLKCSMTSPYFQGEIPKSKFVNTTPDPSIHSRCLSHHPCFALLSFSLINPFCSSNSACFLPPQGLLTCCSLCLELSHHYFLSTCIGNSASDMTSKIYFFQISSSFPSAISQHPVQLPYNTCHNCTSLANVKISVYLSFLLDCNRDFVSSVYPTLFPVPTTVSKS